MFTGRGIGPWFKIILVCSLVMWAGIISKVFFHPGESRQAREEESRGDFFFHRGDTESALACWRGAVAASPRRPGPYEKMSAYYLLAGRWADAGKAAESGLMQLPLCANLYFNLGLSCYFRGDDRRAKENFERVAQLDSYYPDAHYFLGLTYRREGRSADAKQEFIKELNLDPTSRRAWAAVRE